MVKSQLFPLKNSITDVWQDSEYVAKDYFENLDCLHTSGVKISKKALKVKWR